MNQNAVSAAKNAYDIEIECLREMKEVFDEEAYAKAVDLLMRAKKAGLNTEEVKPSELLEIATEEELEQLGLILPEPEEEAESEIIKKAWERARQESLDEPINLDETFEEDLATLPVMYYTLRAVGGWNRGDLHQVEILDTSYLRYYRDENATGQYVIYYNITVAQQNFNNMQLNSNLVFLPLSEVDGVELDGGLIRAETSTNGDMTVSEKHIFPYIPKIQLFTLLILLVMDIGILDFLNIKRSCLDNQFLHGKNLVYILDYLEMRLNLMLNGRSKPAFIL